MFLVQLYSGTVVDEKLDYLEIKCGALREIIHRSEFLVNQGMPSPIINSMCY